VFEGIVAWLRAMEASSRARAVWSMDGQGHGQVVEGKGAWLRAEKTWLSDGTRA